jgi:hypothetical protein
MLFTSSKSTLPGNAAANMHPQQWETVFSMGAVQRNYFEDHRRYSIEFTLTEGINPCGGGVEYLHVTLRVVGGDEKGSFKYDEIVKYGHKKDCAGKGQQHIQKTDPPSRQRWLPTKTRP